MVPARAVLARIAVVIVASWAFWFVSDLDVDAFGFASGQGLVKLVLWALPCVGVAALLDRESLSRAWRGFGLAASALRGYLFGALATIPMLLAWSRMRAPLPRGEVLLGDALLGPLAEEVLFRGFLFFGLRRLGASFWTAALASSMVFGLAHVELDNWRYTFRYTIPAIEIWDFRHIWPMWSSVLGRVAFIGAGGVLFAWVAERRASLWAAIGLHSAINFWWVMTHAGPNGAPLDVTPWVVASALSLAATIALTIRPPASGQPDRWSIANSQ